MCHRGAIKYFPKPGKINRLSAHVEAFLQGPDDARSRIVILPDIYGCSPFYDGLSAYFAQRGAQVFLVDPFAGLGELVEPTKEAAFERRHKVSDKSFLDAFELFAREHRISGVIGFCLGGLYIFELARRGIDGNLIGFYGFPQGLPNKDPIPVPFEYVEHLEKPYSMLMGRDDKSVGPENIQLLEKLVQRNPSTHLVVYESVGHDFLTKLDDAEGSSAVAAQAALKFCEGKLLR